MRKHITTVRQFVSSLRERPQDLKDSPLTDDEVWSILSDLEALGITKDSTREDSRMSTTFVWNLPRLPLNVKYIGEHFGSNEGFFTVLRESSLFTWNNHAQVEGNIRREIIGRVSRTAPKQLTNGEVYNQLLLLADSIIVDGAGSDWRPKKNRLPALTDKRAAFFAVWQLVFDADPLHWGQTHADDGLYREVIRNLANVGSCAKPVLPDTQIAREWFNSPAAFTAEEHIYALQTGYERFATGYDYYAFIPDRARAATIRRIVAYTFITKGHYESSGHDGSGFGTGGMTQDLWQADVTIEYRSASRQCSAKYTQRITFDGVPKNSVEEVTIKPLTSSAEYGWHAVYSI